MVLTTELVAAWSSPNSGKRMICAIFDSWPSPQLRGNLAREKRQYTGILQIFSILTESRL